MSERTPFERREDERAAGYSEEQREAASAFIDSSNIVFVEGEEGGKRYLNKIKEELLGLGYSDAEATRSTRMFPTKVEPVEGGVIVRFFAAGEEEPALRDFLRSDPQTWQLKH